MLLECYELMTEPLLLVNRMGTWWRWQDPMSSYLVQGRECCRFTRPIWWELEDSVVL